MNHNFNVIRRHRNPLLLLNLFFILATLLSATVLAEIFSPPVWKATAKFNVPNSGGNLNTDIGVGTFNEGTAAFSKEVNPLQIQSTIMTSDSVMEKALSIDPDKDSFPRLKAFKSLFTVEPQPQSTVMLLEAKGSSTELALARARNLAKTYQQRLNELRSSDASFRQDFSQEELQQAQDKLVSAQQELAEFRRVTGIVDSENQTQQLVSSINELRTNLTLLQSEAEASQARADIAASQFNTTPERAIQSLNLAENQEYQEVRQKLAQTEIELTEARGKYKDSSPQIQNLLTRREQLTQELNQRVSTAIPNANLEEIDITLGSNNSTKRLDMISELIASQTTTQGLQQQTNQIQNQINKLTSELNAISASKSKLVELERKHSIAEGVYKGIVAQINKAKIDNFNSYPNVQLIDGPVLDPEPEEASKKLILLGGIMASAFGSVSLLLFLESSSPLLSPKDLVMLDYPILFSIGNLKQPYLSWDNLANKRLNSSFEEASKLREYDESYLPIYKDNSWIGKDQSTDWQCNDLTEREFERLATNFRSLELDNGRVMITSAKSGEGKTTITLGLAIALKKLGFQILVVDGDLQRASLSKHINVTPEQREVEDLEIPTTINLSAGLDFIPAPLLPKEKTAEFLAKGNFEQYLDQVQAEGNYDYILVDTSPVHLTSESMLMAPIVENVLFIVRPGNSDRNSVMDSLEQLKLHKAQIQGLILNGVGDSNSSYRYSYYKPQLPPALVAQQAVPNYDSNHN
ncbi:exopolysaccharide transport family protein [Pleurocapsa sp. PCC 7319]|uniref:exopolysaccharide transport family protein n=1 Tax=Pleurocapsa sp. PCC 7319 TaxID=118161 RepID=UPI0003755255|nr:polysaccharide biosynthesis tyrosine autokinase [Pleurocapsa sp. PCC 7319]